TTPRPRTVVHLCDDIACQTAGVEHLCQALEAQIGPPGTPTADDTTWQRSPCLGQCDRAPAALVQHASPDGGTSAAMTPVAAVAGQAARPHYVVCNADESEPGTFKDRVLMEDNPLAIIEAMAIAAFATGCERGYIYVRGEYPLAAERLQAAIGEARALGLLGDTLDVEVRRGAGAYICGEETALFNSIEGYRGEPRNKPPFPTQSGLFRQPTVVNNVETLVNVPEIVLSSGAAYARIGTATSSG